MGIEHATYKRLKQLLLGLPAWTTQEKREELVKDALFGHPILADIRWTNPGSVIRTLRARTSASPCYPGDRFDYYGFRVLRGSPIR